MKKIFAMLLALIMTTTASALAFGKTETNVSFGMTAEMDGTYIISVLLNDSMHHTIYIQGRDDTDICTVYVKTMDGNIVFREETFAEDEVIFEYVSYIRYCVEAGWL